VRYRGIRAVVVGTFDEKVCLEALGERAR